MGLEYYTTRYFKTISSKKGWDENGHYIAKAVYEVFEPKSVVDFGCGTARVINALFNHFKCAEVKGIEGAKAAFEFMHPSVRGFVEQRDVTKPIDLGKKYDIVVCTEVAEHVPTEASEMLVHNLCAAKPGTGGPGCKSHINEQGSGFWLKLFKKQSFDSDWEDSSRYQASLEEDNAKQIYIDNAFVFKRKQ